MENKNPNPKPKTRNTTLAPLQKAEREGPGLLLTYVQDM